MKLEGRDRDIWNAAIKTAATACRKVEVAQRGGGQRIARPPSLSDTRNPHSHLSGDLSLGALRAAQAVEDLMQ